MSICIATGSRSITSYQVVCDAFDSCPYRDEITLLVHGAQPGVKINDQWYPTVDKLAERWAKERGIAIKRFPADWKRFGKRAGEIRNREQTNWAIEEGMRRGEKVFCLAAWDEISTGTADQIEYAELCGLEVIKHIVKVANK